MAALADPSALWSQLVGNPTSDDTANQLIDAIGISRFLDDTAKTTLRTEMQSCAKTADCTGMYTELAKIIRDRLSSPNVLSTGSSEFPKDVISVYLLLQHLLPDTSSIKLAGTDALPATVSDMRKWVDAWWEGKIETPPEWSKIGDSNPGVWKTSLEKLESESTERAARKPEAGETYIPESSDGLETAKKLEEAPPLTEERIPQKSEAGEKAPPSPLAGYINPAGRPSAILGPRKSPRSAMAAASTERAMRTIVSASGEDIFPTLASVSGPTQPQVYKQRTSDVVPTNIGTSTIQVTNPIGRPQFAKIATTAKLAVGGVRLRRSRRRTRRHARKVYVSFRQQPRNLK